MVSAAREVIAIVDHTKWERAAFATFCATDQVGLVLTDAAAPVGMVDELRRRSIDVRLVDHSSPPVSVNEANRRGSSRSTR
jgi:DeoR/GlpR family transcriptional regulator of sugar metabolism